MPRRWCVHRDAATPALLNGITARRRYAGLAWKPAAKWHDAPSVGGSCTDGWGNERRKGGVGQEERRGACWVAAKWHVSPMVGGNCTDGWGNDQRKGGVRQEERKKGRWLGGRAAGQVEPAVVE